MPQSTLAPRLYRVTRRQLDGVRGYHTQREDGLLGNKNICIDTKVKHTHKHTRHLNNFSQNLIFTIPGSAVEVC